MKKPTAKGSRLNASRVKDPAPLIILFILFLILAYASISAFLKPVSESPAVEPEAGCSENQTRYCSVGSCSGLETCRDGRWSGCTWKQVCTPGSAVPCIKDGCQQGLKKCNKCGSAYEECVYT